MPQNFGEILFAMREPSIEWVKLYTSMFLALHVQLKRLTFSGRTPFVDAGTSSWKATPGSVEGDVGACRFSSMSLLGSDDTTAGPFR